MRWPGIVDGSKSVMFVKSPLQNFDPANPANNAEVMWCFSSIPSEDEMTSGFDVLWCQWCLGHLSDLDLTHFMHMCRNALRYPQSFIVVKENFCVQLGGANKSCV